jgi:hypothetical protein
MYADICRDRIEQPATILSRRYLAQKGLFACRDMILEG